MTPNRQLAEELVRRADDCMRERKAALCAAVALSTTSSVRAAIRALEQWDGPDAIRQDAITILSELASEE
jgi:hypothetical protein